MIGGQLPDGALPGSVLRRGKLLLPVRDISIYRAVARRLTFAVIMVIVVAAVVWMQRDGYQDLDGDVSLIDAFYYATVGLSTTGYGDISAVTDSARLVNTLLVMPLRVVFLILLVGTTLEALTSRTREQTRLERWRAQLGGHTVVIGFGTKGAAAADALLREGHARMTVVVVDAHPEGRASANDAGLAAVAGDGTREDVLRAAGAPIADRIIVAVASDEAAVLASLTARRLNPSARIVAAARENTNAELLRDSGADAVVVTSETAGRLLGASITHPAAGETSDALLGAGGVLALRERPVRAQEVGQQATDLTDRVVAVVRQGVRMPREGSSPLEAGDRLVMLIEQSPSRRRA